MILNYIKLAWRVLGRRKFFTFITLFGISFTLGILMVFLSFLQSELGTSAPLKYKDDFVCVEQVQLIRMITDTIPVVDSTLQNGTMVYDTVSYDYKERSSGQSNSEINCQLAEKYLRNLPSAKEVTIFNSSYTNDVFVNGVKVTIQTLMGDPSYWKVFNHKILEGRTIDQNDMDNASNVIVISTKTASEYFGVTSGVVDREIKMDGKTFKVIGLYPDNAKVVSYVSPDAVVPYTIYNMDNQDSYYFGPFGAILIKADGVSAQKLKDEIYHAASTIPIDHPDNQWKMNKVNFRPVSTYNETYARAIYYEDKAEDSYEIIWYVVTGLLLFFILLPTLNLINLNVSRIMDRSSEIGVRKAFGAHQGNIVIQFITENILQTFIGGILGLGLAYLLITLINNGGFLGDAVLRLNTKFFIYSFIGTLLFGILSGFLPALKMSKLQIVNALKENKI